MRVGVVGSRGLTVPDLWRYLPPETTEIISGGAQGVDASAARYARSHGLKLTEFLPDYAQYGRRAPLLRNLEIIVHSDLVLAFWDGKSRGTAFVIDRCQKRGTPVQVFYPNK